MMLEYIVIAAYIYVTIGAFIWGLSVSRMMNWDAIDKHEYAAAAILWLVFCLVIWPILICDAIDKRDRGE